MNELLMDVRKVSKKFPGVQALKDVQFQIYSGEVHALVGENGAGKSTLMNILSGVYQQTEGTMLWKGAEVRFQNTIEPRDLGIAMIHQELSLAEDLSVMENIFMGRLAKTSRHTIDYAKLRQDTAEVLGRVGLSADLAGSKVKELSVSQQQMVEIARALSLNARLLIMDEPSSCLTQNETEILLNLIRELRDQGVAIIYISHRMDEVFEIAQKITVLRDGCVVGSFMADEVSVNQVLSMMVGREYRMEKLHSCRADYQAQPIMTVDHLRYKDIVKDVSFKLYPSEVLVITGLVGAGRTELVETIFGCRPVTSGKVTIEGKDVTGVKASRMTRQGMALVPEGRKLKGILPQRSVEDNIRISALGRHTRCGIIRMGETAEEVKKQIFALNVKTPSVKQLMKYLSGGNQQKVILGRCLMCMPKILIMDEPTNGIDVGAKQEIYKIIDDLSKQGISVICISSEMAEVMQIADRVLVMHEGLITGELVNDGHLSQDTIMQYASNVKAEAL